MVDDELEKKLEYLKALKGKSDKLKVLVVEDEPNIANLIKYYLQDKFIVDIAYLASEAEEKIRSFKPDIITLDIMMPNKDGITFARELKEKGLTKDIPIIFITAKTDWDTKEATLFIDGWAFIEKPFTREQLLEVIQNVLDMKYKLKH